MNTRITQLPNGKWIAEIEVPDLCSLTASGIAAGKPETKWMAVRRRNDQFSLTERGEEDFAGAQEKDRETARFHLALYLGLYYGEVLPEEAKPFAGIPGIHVDASGVTSIVLPVVENGKTQWVRNDETGAETPLPGREQP